MAILSNIKLMTSSSGTTQEMHKRGKSPSTSLLMIVPCLPQQSLERGTLPLKHVVTGRLVTQVDLKPITLESGEIEILSEFQYRRSLISNSGRMDVEVEQRVSRASRVFGALRKVVFLDKNLRHYTKRKIYNGCVL